VIGVAAAAAVLNVGISAGAQQGPIFQPFRIPSPSPPSAFTMLEMKRTRENEVEIVVQVMSTTGHSVFMRWLVDCARTRFMALGSASTREALSRSTPDTNWNRPVEGWTDQAVVLAACDRLKSLPLP